MSARLRAVLDERIDKHLFVALINEEIHCDFLKLARLDLLLLIMNLFPDQIPTHLTRRL